MGRQEAPEDGQLIEPLSIWTNGDPRLHLAAWDADGPPVLLVHGMGANTHWWDACAPLLAEAGLRPAALDLSGHGDSARRPTYDLAHWIDDIELARHALGWPKFFLVAHSLGARVALEYAARNSDRLSALVAVDFLPEVWRSASARFAKRKPRATPVYETRAEPLSRFRLQPEGTSLPPEPIARLGEHCVTKSPDGKWTWKFDWRAFSYEYTPIWDTLPKVQTPTLHVRGEHSTVVNREQFDRIVRETKGSRGLEIAGAHHHVPLDTPVELAKEIISFLNPGATA